MTTPNHTPDALRAQVAELCDIVADEIRFESLDRTSRLRRLIAIATRLRAPEPTGEARYSVAQIEKAVAEAWEVFTADVTHGLPKRGAAQVTDYVTQVLALDASPPAPAPEGETWRTCARCGLADANVLDLDTGAPCHPEWRHCVRALAQRLAAAPEGEERPMWGPHLAWRLMTRDELIAELQRLQDEARQPPFPQQALMDELNEELEAAEQRLAAYDALAGRAKDALVDDSAEHYNVVRDLAAMREG